MKKAIIIVCFIGVIVGLFYYFLNNNNVFVINIENNTGKEVSGMHLQYKNYNKSENIGSITAGEEKIIKVKLPDDFSEGAIVLAYTDENGKLHEEIVFGYIEKGYSGKADVKLESIDENGIIVVKVSEN